MFFSHLSLLNKRHHVMWAGSYLKCHDAFPSLPLPRPLWLRGRW